MAASWLIVALFIGTLLGMAWVEFHQRLDTKRERQESCHHAWGENQSLLDEGVHWYRHCTICGKQDNLPRSPRV